MSSTMLVSFNFLFPPPFPPSREPVRPWTVSFIFSFAPVKPELRADFNGEAPDANLSMPVAAANRPGPPPFCAYSVRRSVAPPNRFVAADIARSVTVPASRCSDSCNNPDAGAPDSPLSFGGCVGPSVAFAIGFTVLAELVPPSRPCLSPDAKAQPAARHLTLHRSTVVLRSWDPSPVASRAFLIERDGHLRLPA